MPPGHHAGQCLPKNGRPIRRRHLDPHPPPAENQLIKSAPTKQIYQNPNDTPPPSAVSELRQLRRNRLHLLRSLRLQHLEVLPRLRKRVLEDENPRNDRIRARRRTALVAERTEVLPEPFEVLRRMRDLLFRQRFVLVARLDLSKENRRRLDDRARRVGQRGRRGELFQRVARKTRHVGRSLERFVDGDSSLLAPARLDSKESERAPRLRVEVRAAAAGEVCAL